MGSPNLKAQPWTNEGGGIWSTPVEHAFGTTTGQGKLTTTAERWTVTTWSQPGKIKTSLAALAVDGDHFHADGAGTPKLYVMSTGGNPGTRADWPRIIYTRVNRALSLIGLTGVTIEDLDFQGYRSSDAAIPIVDSHNTLLRNVWLEGCFSKGLYTQMSKIAGTDQAPNIPMTVRLEDCRGNHAGRGGISGEHLLMNGSSGGAHQVRQLEIIGGEYGPYAGEDVLTCNGKTAVDGVGVADYSHTLLDGVKMWQGQGAGVVENPFDGKGGNLTIRNGWFSGAGQGAGTQAITLHVFMLNVLIENTYIEGRFRSALHCGNNSSPGNPDMNYTVRNNTIEQNATTATTLEIDQDCIPGRVLAEGNTIKGRLDTSANAGYCVHVASNNQIVRDNDLVKRNAAAHLGIDAGVTGTNTGPPDNRMT
jgi:hypothetical protein